MFRKFARTTKVYPVTLVAWPELIQLDGKQQRQAARRQYEADVNRTLNLGSRVIAGSYYTIHRTLVRNGDNLS